MRIDDTVITARMLEGQLQGERRLQVRPDARLTPLALDYVREHDIEVVRGDVEPSREGTPPPTTTRSDTSSNS